MAPPPGFGMPTMYFVNTNEDVTSRGNVYMAFPFEFELPSDNGETQPVIKIKAANSSQELIESVRAIIDPPTVKLEVIASTAPDVVEKTIDFLSLTNVEYDALSITFTLQPINILARSFPNTFYDATEFPDLMYN
jgi:hypothetical protein